MVTGALTIIGGGVATRGLWHSHWRILSSFCRCLGGSFSFGCSKLRQLLVTLLLVRNCCQARTLFRQVHEALHVIVVIRMTVGDMHSPVMGCIAVMRCIGGAMIRVAVGGRRHIVMRRRRRRCLGCRRRDRRIHTLLQCSQLGRELLLLPCHGLPHGRQLLCRGLIW